MKKLIVKVIASAEITLYRDDDICYIDKFVKENYGDLMYRNDKELIGYEVEECIA